MKLVNDRTYSRVYSDEKLRSVKLYDAKYRLKDMVSKADRISMEEKGVYDNSLNYINPDFAVELSFEG